MIDPADAALSALRDGGALDELWRRCAAEIERRGGASGTVPLISDSERRSVGRLLGRRLGSSVERVRIAHLDAALRRSPLHSELAAILPRLIERDLRDLPAERRARRAEADRMWADAAQHPALARHQALETWLLGLRKTGSLRRTAGGEAEDCLRRTLDVLAVLPRPHGQEQLLAELAQQALGDPHALDPGHPVGVLVLRGLAHLEGETVRGAGERRWLWYRYGVVCDRLSSTVLVLNLQASSPAALARLLAAGAAEGVPAALTLHQVQQWCRRATWTASRVLVCENPSVMDRIASSLGPRAAPLVCISGQMSLAARRLLRSLVAAGVEVAYHGDFDWGGLEIGNQVIRLGAVPWRYRSSDYVAAADTTDGSDLQGRRVGAIWDPELAIVMEQRGRVVYEESVLDQLCEDALGNRCLPAVST